MPTGTATFPKSEMMNHVIEYHTRFGMRNQRHLLRSLEVLRENGYTDCDLVDMYSVLQNRPFQHVDEILAGSTPSVKANA
jgi:hypothetical protein